MIALIIQLMGFGWERSLNSAWRGLKMPVTLEQVLMEWATYMLIFITVSTVL